MKTIGTIPEFFYDLLAYIFPAAFLIAGLFCHQLIDAEKHIAKFTNDNPHIIQLITSFSPLVQLIATAIAFWAFLIIGQLLNSLSYYTVYYLGKIVIIRFWRLIIFVCSSRAKCCCLESFRTRVDVDVLVNNSKKEIMIHEKYSNMLTSMFVKIRCEYPSYVPELMKQYMRINASRNMCLVCSLLLLWYIIKSFFVNVQLWFVPYLLGLLILFFLDFCIRMRWFLLAFSSIDGMSENKYY